MSFIYMRYVKIWFHLSENTVLLLQRPKDYCYLLVLVVRIISHTYISKVKQSCYSPGVAQRVPGN